MALPHTNDNQNEHINTTNEAPYEWENIKEVGAIGIGEGSKGSLESIFIPAHNHKTNVGYNTSHQDREGHHKRHSNNDKGKVETVGNERKYLGGDELRKKKPLPE